MSQISSVAEGLNLPFPRPAVTYGYANGCNACYINAFSKILEFTGIMSRAIDTLSWNFAGAKGMTLGQAMTAMRKNPSSEAVVSNVRKLFHDDICQGNESDATLARYQNTQKCVTETLEVFRANAHTVQFEGSSAKELPISSFSSYCVDGDGLTCAHPFLLCAWRYFAPEFNLFEIATKYMGEMGFQITHFGDIVSFFCPAVNENMELARDLPVLLKPIVEVSVAGSSDVLVYRLVGAVETTSAGRDAGHHISWLLNDDGVWYRVNDRTKAERRPEPSKNFSLIVYERVFPPFPVGLSTSLVSNRVPCGPYYRFKAVERLLREYRPESTIHSTFSRNMLLGLVSLPTANRVNGQETRSSISDLSQSTPLTQSDDEGWTTVKKKGWSRGRAHSTPRSDASSTTSQSAHSMPKSDGDGWNTAKRKGADRRRTHFKPLGEQASPFGGQPFPKSKENVARNFKRVPNEHAADTSDTTDDSPKMDKAKEENTSIEATSSTFRQETAGHSSSKEIVPSFEEDHHLKKIKEIKELGMTNLI